MIQALLRVVPPADKRDEFLTVLQSLSGPTEVTYGCHACRILRDAANANAITYLVQWDRLEQLEEHFRSNRFRHILPYIDMSTEVPQLNVSRLDAVGGMEVMLEAINTRAT
ncbi:putative quinol monooxygenase [Roseiconus lacunae]|uniref:putative quinol monooxygenase n=1 Tax=Roseiconus lacunae TaxID=2605694 RepID=UPI0011F208EC|nr:antibiotic biosynthesis monooxygenase [Roseiconus lacunae]MCD0460238.1 antibiotic biosynthesis monooxygenase [Roseiconus lacunae]